MRLLSPQSLDPTVYTTYVVLYKTTNSFHLLPLHRVKNRNSFKSRLYRQKPQAGIACKNHSSRILLKFKFSKYFPTSNISSMRTGQSTIKLVVNQYSFNGRNAEALNNGSDATLKHN